MSYDLSKKQGAFISVKWYKKNRPDLYRRNALRRYIRRLERKKYPLYIDFIKWIWIDFLRGKWLNHPLWGIYNFVALPGEGKTLSMVAHILKEREKNPDIKVFTNFYFKGQDGQINHWTDIIRFSKWCRVNKCSCIVALDEIHLTFDASDYHSFPAEMLSLLSFNRKFRTQFLCSSQRYDRIPKKIRDISNYTVLCKNVGKFDRLFFNYYFDTNDYESTFSGKKVKCNFVRQYVATDELYSYYDTLAQVDRMSADAKTEKDKRLEAVELLFGKRKEE